MKLALLYLALIAFCALVWLAVITAAMALGPAPFIALFIVLLGLVLWYELGPNGSGAQARRASENLRDVAQRARERDPYSSTGRGGDAA